MKKTILALSFLCSLGFAAQGQTPWISQNNSAPTTAPAYRSMQMHVVNEQVAWHLLQLDASNTPATHFSKTTNGGVSWDFLPITGGTQGYQAASIHAIDASTAFIAQFGASNGGEVLKTVNGGRNWTKTTTTAQFVATSGGFLNWIHFFDANNGVAFGDPSGGYFEVLTTSNGGTTWTRVPAANLPAANSQEGGLVGSYAAFGNTVWAGTSRSGQPARVLKSTDRGLTWTTSANTPLVGAISKIAMTDANNGIAFRDGDMIATTDGGQTWKTQNYKGNFCHDDAANVPGTKTIVSVGSSVTSATSLNDVGSSQSNDNGATWTDIDRGTIYYTTDFAGAAIGYAGAVTQFNGTGGVYKASATILGTRGRDAALQKAMSVFPNPSASGVFQLQLASAIKAGTSVHVFDALGRQVLSQPLNATASAVQTTSVDLSKQKAGLYTLELRTATGVAQQKLVIE